MLTPIFGHILDKFGNFIFQYLVTLDEWNLFACSIGRLHSKINKKRIADRKPSWKFVPTPDEDNGNVCDLSSVAR